MAADASWYRYLREVLHDTTVQIVVGAALAVIVLALGILKRHLWRRLWEGLKRELVFLGYVREFLPFLRERHHPAAGLLALTLARESAADLFAGDGEQVTVDKEYVDLLERSLDPEFQHEECIYLAKTKPSDWFAPTGGLASKAIAYLDRQKALVDRGVRVRRYILLGKKKWQADKKRPKLIEAHIQRGIDLYWCDVDEDPVKRYTYHDMALFRDKRGRAWAVEGLDFDDETIAKYGSGLPQYVHVRIEDRQQVLKNWYKHSLRIVEENSTKQ